MISYNHVRIVILIISSAALSMTACGSTGSNGGTSASSNGTGAAAGTGASTNGGSATGANGGTAGIGGGTETGTSGGSGGGAETGTSGGSGGSSGGGGGAAAKPLYLVSIDHWASPSRLLKIDVSTGIGKKVCDLPVDFDGVNYHSSTFSRDGILFASNANAGRIDRINPCTCAVEQPLLGPTGFGSIPGITANQENGLYGVEITQDLLLDIDTISGAGTKIEPLGADFQNTGATWSDALFDGQGGIYAIDGTHSKLYTINPWLGPDGPGIVPPPIDIVGITFGSVGVEMHPANGVIYACTNDTVLYSIDPVTGVATGIGAGMGQTITCNNLAAPWTPIACLDAF